MEKEASFFPDELMFLFFLPFLDSKKLFILLVKPLKSFPATLFALVFPALLFLLFELLNLLRKPILAVGDLAFDYSSLMKLRVRLEMLGLSSSILIFL